MGYSHKIKTRPAPDWARRIIHRHKLRFALMNTAPAELLHFLTIAALQPSTSPPSAPRSGGDIQILVR
jgi:hypothetical protein